MQGLQGGGQRENWPETLPADTPSNATAENPGLDVLVAESSPKRLTDLARCSKERVKAEKWLPRGGISGRVYGMLSRREELQTE